VPGCQATFNALSTGGSSDVVRSKPPQTLHTTGANSVVAAALRTVGSDRTLTAVQPLESYLFGR
jgi:hypothetical protein